ncbi:hypothetical protein JG687_00015932 [Phytophthora cactorum]|uniref:Uncharacterized protein n=1 Tax=Phytophthora cactorum TaxID=29920 RepID=A0A8T1TUZ8_9STRA|nr:hypothetical protein JG687_00015932 [Phytophthora cactorum]
MILVSRGLRLPAKENYDTSIESKVDYVEEFLLHKAPRGNDMNFGLVFDVSPQNFYDSLNTDVYTPVKTVVQSKRYKEILNALGVQSDRTPSSSDIWTAPFEHDQHLVHTMRRVCS